MSVKITNKTAHFTDEDGDEGEMWQSATAGKLTLQVPDVVYVTVEELVEAINAISATKVELAKPASGITVSSLSVSGIAQESIQVKAPEPDVKQVRERSFEAIHITDEFVRSLVDSGHEHFRPQFYARNGRPSGVSWHERDGEERGAQVGAWVVIRPRYGWGVDIEVVSDKELERRYEEVPA